MQKAAVQVAYNLLLSLIEGEPGGAVTQANIEISYEQINMMMQHDSWFIGYFVKMDVYAKIKELNCFVFCNIYKGPPI